MRESNLQVNVQKGTCGKSKDLGSPPGREGTGTLWIKKGVLLKNTCTGASFHMGEKYNSVMKL